VSSYRNSSVRITSRKDLLFATQHSLILKTFQPCRRKRRVIRRSRLRLFSILFFQNSTFDVGSDLHLEQPCQKQPSTNIAILRPGQAKSGLPGTGQCFL
jgi:hypothetical protein